MPAKDSAVPTWLVQSLFGVLVSICMAISGYCFTQIGALSATVDEIHCEMSSVQSNYITACDALLLWKGINQNSERIAELPKEVPPQWFIERVDKIEASLEKIKDRLPPQ